MRATVLVLLLTGMSVALHGQQQPDQPPSVARDVLPPSTVLQQELTDLDRFRSDMANWSAAELAAFDATATRANADCVRIEGTAHEGDEELALARLCALGRNWDGVYSAARWYTRRTATPEPAHLAAGFALLLQADLNLQAVERAVMELAEMQERLPFTADTDAVFNYAIAALEINRAEQGLRAAALRQPRLLEAVAGTNDTVLPGTAEAEAWHGLALLHAFGSATEEAAQRQQLLDAMARRTAPLLVSEQYVAQRGRGQYEWLGKPLPQLSILRSTYKALPAAAAAPASATLLVMDVANAPDVPTLSLAVDSLRTRLQPGWRARLVLSGQPVEKPERAPVVHADYVAPALLDRFGYESGPVFVATDAAGRITWLSAGTPGWLNPRQQAEVLLERAASPPAQANVDAATTPR